MDIACVLVTEGKFENAAIPQELLLDLITSLRNKGSETVHFATRSIEVEGVYIPAKGSKTKLMTISEMEE